MALNILLAIIAVLLFVLAAMGFGLLLLKPGTAGLIAAKAKDHIGEFKSAYEFQKKEEEDHSRIKFSRRLTQAQFERQAEEAKLREMEEGRG